MSKSPESSSDRNPKQPDVAKPGTPSEHANSAANRDRNGKSGVVRERLLRKGRIAFRNLIESHGGVYTIEEAAELLGVEPDTVRRYIRDNRLLAFEQDGQRVLPVWQFVDGQIVPHFSEVLALLEPDDPVARIRFFLLLDSDLGMNPIGALLNEWKLDLVRRRARQFGKHVAT